MARPALLIKTSMCETCWTICEMAVLREVWSWTSTTDRNIFRLECLALRESDMAFSLSPERAKRMSVASSAARRWAMAAPMPIDAPVMRTVWPLSDMVGDGSGNLERTGCLGK